jgi:hypothetical protein
MRRLLQSIIHNRKLYDRPQDEWVCGRAAEGCPCVFGPDKKGGCRATSQCLPAKKGDRWVCTRAISLGGACAPGPGPDGGCGCPVEPCTPVHSLRARRGRLTRLVMVLAAGVSILALWGFTRTTWSSPGPLTAQHAVSAQRCADCHLEPGLLARLTGDSQGRLQANNLLCLKCHDLGKNSHSPHGVPASELLALARQLDGGAPAIPMMQHAAHALAAGGSSELACATCHQEHHGRDADLRQMSDRQCQSCHQAPFVSFAAGHPQFTDYPSTRRTRLQFDHVAHWQKHFAEPRMAERAPSSCADCHEPAADGRKMLVRGFEQSCAKCHAHQIEGEGRADATGLVFLRLPEVDVAALEAAGLPVGDWPQFAEGEITPFMRWMLEGDPLAQEAMTGLGSVPLAALARATPAQKAAAAQLVWSIKGLVADLITQGQQVMLRRLNATGGVMASGRHTGRFSADGLQAAQHAWLPNLLEEVAAHRRGGKPAPRRSVTAPVAKAAVSAAPAVPLADPDDLLADLPATPAKDDLLAGETIPAAKEKPAAGLALEYDDAEARVAEGGWYRRDENYTIYYRPGGHADEFLAAWLETAAHNDGPAAQAIFAQLAAPKAPGLCMKCHTVDGTGTAAVVNWHTARPEPHQRPFTTFKHAPHFSLMGVQGCSTCHVMDPKADYAGAFGTKRDPGVFHSSFSPLTKDSCVACHQPALAGSSCLQCHNYHTGELAGLHLRAAVRKEAPARAAPAKPNP